MEEQRDKRRAKSIEDFELKYIDVPWRRQASKIDDNKTIYVIKYMDTYKGVP